MRAIITIETQVTKSAFESIAKSIQWWPSVPASDVEQQRVELVSLVADADRNEVEHTYWFMLRDVGRTKSWALVNAPAEGIIEIRVRNSRSTALRLACEDIVTRLQTFNAAGGAQFRFDKWIEVLEPTSDHHAYFGRVLPSGRARWALARRERSIEWRIGVCLAVAAFVAVIASAPLIGATSDTAIWVRGIVERLGTSAAATSLASFLAVGFHYSTLRRIGTVDWRIGRE